jgi:hypothetical protein
MNWVCVFDVQQGIEFILLECVRSKNQKRHVVVRDVHLEFKLRVAPCYKSVYDLLYYCWILFMIFNVMVKV